MSLGERLRSVIKESGLTQAAFAKENGIALNYLNAVLNGRKTNFSIIFAKSIEQKYGYSAEWVLNGTGKKFDYEELSQLHLDIIRKVKRMSQREATAVYAFIDSLHTVIRTIEAESTEGKETEMEIQEKF